MSAKLTDHPRISTSYGIQCVADMESLNGSSRTFYLNARIIRIGKCNDRPIELLFHTRGKNTHNTLMPSFVIDTQRGRKVTLFQ